VKAAQPKVDHGAVAVKLLRAAVASGDVQPVYQSPDALYGIERSGVWAGEIEGLLGQLSHKDRTGLRRAARKVARSVIDDSTRPPLREVPPLPLLVVHGPSWRVAAGDRYLTVQRELVVVELGRLHGVATTIPVGESGSRALKPQEAYEAHGVTADRVRWTYGAAGAAWDSQTRTLDLPGARVRDGEAIRSARVERWLELLGAGAILLDWLATAPLLDRPTSALQIRGPAGIGKGLIAAGLANWLGGRTTYAEATGPYDAELIHGPLVVLDEGVAESRPDAFRRLTGNFEHRVSAKYRMAEDLRGCPRILITSNEHDPLRLGREELSAESEHALGQRIIVVEGSIAAGRYLASLGGWQETGTWCEPDGELVRHFRWLAETRDVSPGRRYLVEGDAGAWVAAAHLRRGVGADVLAAYQAHQEDAAIRDRCDGDPFVHDGDLVGISPGSLLRSWRLLLGPQERIPSSQALARVLKRLAGQDKPSRGGPEGDRGPRRYWVASERLTEGDDG